MTRRTLALRAPQAISPDDVLVVDRDRAGPRQIPASITVETRLDLYGGGRMLPVQFIDVLADVTVSDGRLDAPTLDQYSTYIDGAFDGGVVHRFRPSETGLREIAPLRIKRTRINRYDTPAGTFRFLQPGQTLRWSPNDWFGPGVPLQWGLCYFHADGRYSPAAPGPVYTVSASPRSPRTEDGEVPDTALETLEGTKTVSRNPHAGHGDAPPEGPILTTDNGGRQVVLTMPDIPLPDGVLGLVPVFSVRGDLDAELALEVEPADDLSADDIHVVRKVLGNEVKRERFLHPRFANFRKVKVAPDSTDTNFADEPNGSGAFYRWVEDPEQGPVLRVHLPPRSEYKIYMKLHGGTGGLYYQMLEPDVPCTGTVHVRLAAGSPRAEIRWGGFADDGGSTPSDPVALEPHWRETAATRAAPNPPLTTRGLARVELVLRGGEAGGAVDVQAAWFRANAELHEYPPNQLADLKAFQPRAYRDHQVKRRPNGMSLEMALGEVLGVPWWSTDSHARTFKTVEWLREQGVTTIPWVQPPWFWTDAEIDGYWEYCCTPFDPDVDDAAEKPWAARRHAHGFTDTIQNLFPQVQLEVGNELWQLSGGFYNFFGASKSFSSGRLAGMMTNRYVERARANPYFDRSRWTIYGGGWGGAGGSYAQGRTGDGGYDYDRAQFNGQFMAQCRELDAFGYATYMGGWDSGQGVLEPDAYGRFYLLSDPFGGEARQGRSVTEIVERLAEDVRLYENDTGRVLRAEHYEAGPGYDPFERDRDKLRLQSEMMKGRVPGTAFLALALRSAASGLTATNFFTFGRGRLFQSHHPLNTGGAASGAWQWMTWMNQWGIGETVVLDREQGGVIFGPATRDATEDTVHGGRDSAVIRVVAETHVSYVAFNLRQDRDIALRIVKPSRIAGPVTRWEMTGSLESTNATFETRDDLRLVSTREPEGFGTQEINARVPPGSAIAWVFAIGG